MRLDEPAWWYTPAPSPLARALRPMAEVYGWAAQYRYRRAQPYRSELPVICIGNLVAGGTGKTPLSLRIAEDLVRLGARPAVLTRGYGGRQAGPSWVDPALHTAADVGDEAMLMAARVPTLVARNRSAGAQAIEADSRGFSVIVMDDGLQNPALHKDLVIAVVDGRRGIGNGEVMPAGPLRAPLAFQFDLIHAILINHPPGDDVTVSAVAAWLRRDFPGPVLEAETTPHGDTVWLGGARVIAYAGIANPGRFFELVAKLGADTVDRVAFPDHHAFSERDAERVLALARQRDALPVTTEKDMARLAGASGRRGELRKASRALGIALALSERDGGRLDSLLQAALTSCGQSRSGAQDRTRSAFGS